jgi:hypothetical protein
MPFSVRLDADTESKIRYLSTATGRSKSEVVREAVARYELDPRPEPDVSAFDRLKPYVGIVRTGGDYSKDTHAKYRALLQGRHRARVPRRSR